MTTLFITGASGFIGRHLIQKISHLDFKKIYCLTRQVKEATQKLPKYVNMELLEGDISDPKTYTEALASSDIVIHLAAKTGKAKPAEYFDVNSKGTELLVDQSKRLGVQFFLFVSSIAVKYQDISKYYYAQSKRQAEEIVRVCGLDFTILRPTIVIGEDGTSWQSLAKLARKPVIGIFGDGSPKIQPILVDDLVHCILSVIKEKIFLNEVYDVGGPEVITLEDFLVLIYTKSCGKNPRVIHIPIYFLIPVLTVLEKLFPSMLPLNVGQLSPFRYDSSVEENSLFSRCKSHMKNNSDMLDAVINEEKEDIHLVELYKEAHFFTKYLLESAPNDYVLNKYEEGHGKCSLYPYGQTNAFDKILIKLARLNQFFLRMIDGYCRIFYKNAMIRKKLTLVLAILESCSPFHEYLDSVVSYSKSKLFAVLLMKPLLFGFHLALSTLVIGPFHIAFAAASKLRGWGDSANPKEMA